MAQFRLSRLARADLAHILATSALHWGTEARRRYAAMLVAGMRRVAAEPQGSTTQDRSELAKHVRSFHLRNVRADAPESRVRRPVHVLYYRAVRPGLVEIVRVLHERMDPARHLSADPHS